jgi:predicted alpha/beta hydrolase family esterase
MDLNGPNVLAAHGLGCHLAAAWGARGARGTAHRP